MTTPSSKQYSPEFRLKEMAEENELLRLQLYQVHEELERHYQKNQQLEKAPPVVSSAGAELEKRWVDDELPDVLAENRRLRAVVEVQRKVSQLESQNALNVKLGNILIQGVDSPGALLGVPGKLGRIWRESSRQTPPQAFGGASFDKVITAYREGGFEAVEKLIAGISITPAMQANAYTALGRQLIKTDRAATAEAARRAHALDPKPYRLKWLAFRLHEAGEVVEAEAMLDVLPSDTEFSDSEKRQASRLRNEAKVARLREATQETKFAERRAEFEKQLDTLSRDIDKQRHLATERGKTIESLKQAKGQLEQEKKLLAGQLEEQRRQAQKRGEALETSKRARTQLDQKVATLARQYDEQKELAKDRGDEVDALQQAKARLEHERAVLSACVDRVQKEKEEQQAEQSLLLEQLRQVQEELEHCYVENEEQKQEISVLAARYEEQTKIAIGRNEVVEALQQTQAQLEEEKASLTGLHDEQAKLAAERGQALKALRQAKARLEDEKAALTKRYDEQAKLTAERTQTLKAVRQAKAQLEEEKAALAGQFDEQAKLAAERGQTLKAVRQAKAQLEEEKAALAGQYEEQAKLAAERGQALKAVRQAKAQLEEEKAALTGQYEEQAKLAAERGQALKALRQVKAQLEEDKIALAGRYDGEVKLAAERGQALKAQTEAKAQLEQDKAVLAVRCDEQAKLAAERGQALEALKQAQKRLEQEKADLSVRLGEMQKTRKEQQSELDMLLEQLHSTQEELERAYQRDQEQKNQMTVLMARYEEQARITAERHQAIELLQQAKAQLDQEMMVLAERHEVQSRLVVEQQSQLDQLSQANSAAELEHVQELEELKRVQGELENEMNELAARHEEQSRLVVEQQSQLDQLSQAKSAAVLEHVQELEALKRLQGQLEQEKTDLAAKHEKQAKLAVERGQLVEASQKAKAQLDQEMMVLAARHDEQARLALERQSQLEQLRHEKSAAELEYVREVEALKLTRGQLEREIADLAAKHRKQAELAADRQTKIEQLEQVVAAAELENGARVAALQKQSTVYSKEIESLKSKFALAQKEKGGLGEMVRDLVPFFYGRRLTYVDVGAYVGDVFLAFANSELKIREAHLVEPNSRTYQTLVENTSALLKNGSLHHYCLAIDREPGQVILLPGASMSKTVPLHSGDLVEIKGKDTCVIESTTLDLLIDRITETHIDLLKIDVEGFEENVLSGATNVLHRQLVDVVVIEVGMNPDGKQQCYYRKIDDLMQEAGYRIFRIYDQMYEWISDSPFMRRANFVYMSEKFARSSPYRLTQELYKKEKIIEGLKTKIQSKVEND